MEAIIDILMALKNDKNSYLRLVLVMINAVELRFYFYKKTQIIATKKDRYLRSFSNLVIRK